MFLNVILDWGQILLAYQKVHLLLAELCDSVSNDVVDIGVGVASEIMANMNENP